MLVVLFPKHFGQSDIWKTNDDDVVHNRVKVKKKYFGFKLYFFRYRMRLMFFEIKCIVNLHAFALFIIACKKKKLKLYIVAVLGTIF